MGTWGYEIGESDVFADVYGRFFEAYNSGASPEQATKLVYAELADHFTDSDDQFDAHYALALASWETMALGPDVLDKVQRYIDSGADLENWASRGGSSGTDQSNRQAALKRFLAKLQKPRTSKKRRSRPKFEFSLVPLLELPSPDSTKTLSIAEEYTNGKFIHTSAVLKWPNGCGSGIFHTAHAELEFRGKWLDANNLELTIPKSIKDELERDSLAQIKMRECYFCGELVSLHCKFV